MVMKAYCFQIIFLSLNFIVYEICLYNFKVYLDNLYHNWIEKLFQNKSLLDKQD